MMKRSGTNPLLDRARAAGEQAYVHAEYDLALALIMLARVLKTAGGSDQALPLLDESRERFEAIATEQDNKTAEVMASICLVEQGDCLLHVGRLDEAADAYEEQTRTAAEFVGLGGKGSVTTLTRHSSKSIFGFGVSK